MLEYTFYGVSENGAIQVNYTYIENAIVDDAAAYARDLGEASSYIAIVGKPVIATTSPLYPLWMSSVYAERIQLWIDDQYGAGTKIDVVPREDGTFDWFAVTSGGVTHSGNEPTRKAARDAANAALAS